MNIQKFQLVIGGLTGMFLIFFGYAYIVWPRPYPSIFLWICGGLIIVYSFGLLYSMVKLQEKKQNFGKLYLTCSTSCWFILTTLTATVTNTLSLENISFLAIIGLAFFSFIFVLPVVLLWLQDKDALKQILKESL